MEGFNTYEQQDKVLVGMSGGVDSSVTVRILQEQGFAVQGAVIRFSPAHDGAVAEAKAAAETLGVPVHVIDAGAEFEREVVTPFCADYCAGRTPNPCILCNPAVKFKLLAQKADELGIRFIATGHYARIERCADGVCRLCAPESAARDQTYMLYRLGGELLDRLILPLGEFEKDDVREIARDIGLSCADAPDSMEICFIPDGDHAAFIRSRGMQPKAGRFLGPDGGRGPLHGGPAQRAGHRRRAAAVCPGDFGKRRHPAGRERRRVPHPRNGGQRGDAGRPAAAGGRVPGQSAQHRRARPLPRDRRRRRADGLFRPAGAGRRAGPERRLL